MEWTTHLAQGIDLLTTVLIFLMAALMGVMALLTVVHGLLLAQAIRGQRHYRNHRQNPPEDITGTHPHFPEKAEALAETAEQLGFDYLGAAGIQQGNDLRIDWIYIDDEQTTILLIVPNGKRYAGLFYSVCADGFTLQTVHPQGVSIYAETIETNSIKTSLEAALDFHLTHRLSHRQEHGKLQHFPDMATVLPWLTDHIQRHVPLQIEQMRNQTLRTLSFIVTTLIITSIGLYLILTQGISLGLIVALLLMAVIAIIGSRTLALPKYLATVEQRKKKKRNA
ncbi:MAG: hypothetical protein KC546_02900 [Anaerolineae bacterium]|nr:hypothetical protein [Anaerolineae bacterium]MCA9893110.1 hypothetical protein [Anaerolineae bacterium]